MEKEADKNREEKSIRMKKSKLKNNKIINTTYNSIMKTAFQISPRTATKVFFRVSMGYPLSLDNPKTFNEKINWLKFNDDLELKTKCADKIEVRNYVESKGLKNILNDIYYIYDIPQDINFEKLPNSFVLKTNHSCGTNIIVNDKNNINKEETLIKLDKWLKTKYGTYPYEPQYLNIEPRILCEKNLCDNYGEVPEDYKFYCSKGKVLMFSIIHRPPKPQLPHIYHFNEKKEFLETNYNNYKELPKIPNNIDDMLEVARKLSEDFNFVRVDLYDFNDKDIIFGELTFTPTGGFYNYISKELDLKIGEMISIYD